MIELLTQELPARTTVFTPLSISTTAKTAIKYDAPDVSTKRSSHITVLIASSRYPAATSRVRVIGTFETLLKCGILQGVD